MRVGGLHVIYLDFLALWLCVAVRLRRLDIRQPLFSGWVVGSVCGCGPGMRMDGCMSRCAGYLLGRWFEKYVIF